MPPPFTIVGKSITVAGRSYTIMEIILAFAVLQDNVTSEIWVFHLSELRKHVIV